GAGVGVDPVGGVALRGRLDQPVAARCQLAVGRALVVVDRVAVVARLDADVDEAVAADRVEAHRGALGVVGVVGPVVALLVGVDDAVSAFALVAGLGLGLGLVGLALVRVGRLVGVRLGRRLAVAVVEAGGE